MADLLSEDEIASRLADLEWEREGDEIVRTRLEQGPAIAHEPLGRRTDRALLRDGEAVRPAAVAFASRPAVASVDPRHRLLPYVRSLHERRRPIAKYQRESAGPHLASRRPPRTTT